MTKTVKGASKGAGSFCVPRAAIEALLNAAATAYEICTYLVLAKCTDETGCYSSAGIKAVNTATGANKTKGGPVDRAIERLKTIRATRPSVRNWVGYGSTGRVASLQQCVEEADDLGPILFDRGTWQDQTGDVLPDGPSKLSVVRYVLPDFGEEQSSRVWFGNNLVSGVDGVLPLREVKNAGDVAARLLLALYAANDMEIWGGVRPCGPDSGPWRRYEAIADDVHLKGDARLIRAKAKDQVAERDERVSGESADEAYWDALAALKSSGLIYEVVMVLNREPVRCEFSTGKEFGAIPEDAEPSYELDARSVHGYKPKGEEGIGGATALTAGALDYPVAREGGQFDGTYAAIVRWGYPAMIAGIYRLRFRVSNPKNAGVKSTWWRIHQNNREAFEFVQTVRKANNLAPLEPPWGSSSGEAVDHDLELAVG